MTPKLTNEMRDALHRNHGRPVEVQDEQGSEVYVLIDKSTFAHLQEAQGHADEDSRQHLRSLIEDGIASGEYQAGDKVFADLRQYAGRLASHHNA